MTYYEKERLVKELEKETNLKLKIKVLEKKLSQLDILKLASYLNDNEKKQFIYDNYVFNNPYTDYENLSMYLRNDQDRICLINSLIKYNSFISAYDVVKFMNDPKQLDKEVLRKILHSCKNISVCDVIKDFDLLFVDELVTRKDYYELLKYKNKLSLKIIKDIYIKSFSSLDDYKKIANILSFQEKKEYTKLFLREKCDNAFIANEILKNNYCEKEDYEKLLLIVGMFAKADVIYDVLMRENLSESQRKMLEKALLETGDIEYISYYYFYKNKEKFKLLFGSSLLFLAYVQMNKEKFLNKNILKEITESIKQEDNDLFSSIESKIGVSYTKKPKKNVK